MIANPTRVVAVGTSPVDIRKAPSAPNDPLAAPVTYSTLRYASGGGTIELVPFSTSVFGDGQTVDADADFNDISQAIKRYAVSSSGTVNVKVTDYVA